MKTFSHLYQAITDLPRDDARREPLLNLWFNLEEEEESRQLGKFDANVCELGRECFDFWLSFAREAA